MLASIFAFFLALLLVAPATAQYRYASSIPSAHRPHVQHLCAALAEVHRAMNAEEVVEEDLAASLAHATATVQTFQPHWTVEIATIARSTRQVVHLTGPDDTTPLFDDPPPDVETFASKFVVLTDGDNWTFCSTVAYTSSANNPTTVALREEEFMVQTEDAVVLARYPDIATTIFPFLNVWKGVR